MQGTRKRIRGKTPVVPSGQVCFPRKAFPLDAEGRLKRIRGKTTMRELFERDKALKMVEAKAAFIERKRNIREGKNTRKRKKRDDRRGEDKEPKKQRTAEEKVLMAAKRKLEFKERQAGKPRKPKIQSTAAEKRAMAKKRKDAFNVRQRLLKNK